MSSKAKCIQCNLVQWWFVGLLLESNWAGRPFGSLLIICANYWIVRILTVHSTPRIFMGRINTLDQLISRKEYQLHVQVFLCIYVLLHLKRVALGKPIPTMNETLCSEFQALEMRYMCLKLNSRWIRFNKTCWPEDGTVNRTDVCTGSHPYPYPPKEETGAHMMRKLSHDLQQGVIHWTIHQHPLHQDPKKVEQLINSQLCFQQLLFFSFIW